MIILHYSVEIIKNKSKSKYELNEYNVLLQNKDFVVINDWRFTSIRITSGRDKELGKPSIFEMNFGMRDIDGIYYKLYSDKEVPLTKIKTDILAWVHKKYGYLIDLDLGFIK